MWFGIFMAVTLAILAGCFAYAIYNAPTWDDLDEESH